MSDASAPNSTSRPEALRNRYRNGRQTKYSFPSTPLPHGIQFIFKKYDYNTYINSINKGELAGKTKDNDPNRVQKFTFNPLANANKGPVPSEFTSIELPFPRTLTDATAINNQSFERSFLFERLTGALASSGDLSGLTESISGLASGILGAVRGIGKGESVENAIKQQLESEQAKKSGINFGNIAAASQYLARTFLPGDLQKQAGQAAGVAANPQTTLAFTGVDLKNYSFSWDLFPANKSDSEQIQQIIRALKNCALPGVNGIADVPGLQRAYLTYPQVVIVNLLGVDETHFVRFKPAMLTNVTVEYGAPGGMISIIKGGKPASLSLRLDFTELNIHTAEDYAAPSDEDIGDSSSSSTVAPPAAN